MTSPRGEEILFDLDDLPLVSQLRWRVKPSSTSDAKYAKGDLAPGKSYFLHRYLLGIRDPRIHVDHINGDGLDNRRANLRLASRSQNMANRRAWGETSGFKGVTKIPYGFRFQLQFGGEIRLRGEAKDEIIAAMIYDHACEIYHGAYGRKNFNQDEDLPDSRYIPISEDIRAGRASRYATIFQCEYRDGLSL